MSLYDATTFEEFWQHYQELHASRQVRIAHAVATTSALGLLAASLVRRSWKLALAAPLVDYAIAQASHRRERVTTHPYRHPRWHLRAELRLWRRTLRRGVSRTSSS
ncbi:MAG TPA: Mpo1-like protein [Kofleriaceae bacterium]|nr:Mpo1-like protein [Kofleriaceae bacterium]